MRFERWHRFLAINALPHSQKLQHIELTVTNAGIATPYQVMRLYMNYQSQVRSLNDRKYLPTP